MPIALIRKRILSMSMIRGIQNLIKILGIVRPSNIRLPQITVRDLELKTLAGGNRLMRKNLKITKKNF